MLVFSRMAPRAFLGGVSRSLPFGRSLATRVGSAAKEPVSFLERFWAPQTNVHRRLTLIASWTALTVSGSRLDASWL